MWAQPFDHSGWSHLIPLPSIDGSEESFAGVLPSSDPVNSESVVGLKPGYSGIAIGYQVDNFTHTWSMEILLLDHKFTLGSWARCQLKPTSKSNWVVRVIHFFDQDVKEFEYVLYSIFTDFIETATRKIL